MFFIIDYEKIFFFLKDYPYPDFEYKTFISGWKEREKETFYRLLNNNILWAEKIIKKMVQQAYINAKNIEWKCIKNSRNNLNNFL